ncbi:MAG TPA: hypothetical protein VE088_06540 [Gaiellaceae bacterium]|nr:hypothetical protein [Gaiellaceae bacterium]
MGRVLGPALRAAARSGRRAGRSLRRPLIEERIELGAAALTILRPPSADELIDEAAFDEDEFLPYWAELWPSGIALAQAVAARDVQGLRVVELGCGLGLPSLAAALGGADVLATDWAEEAVALLRRNADQLAALLPRLGTETLLAEPGRPHARAFLERLGAEPAGERLFRIRLP